MRRISAVRKEGEPDLFIPSDKFNRGIGRYAGEKYTIKGEKFIGNDEDYESYLISVLPTEEDEAKLMNDYMKRDWIQYREWKGQ